MKQYCLKDIRWIYTQDGKFVTPFIFNKNDTKIMDLANNEIIELPDTDQTAYDKVASIYAETLHINEDDLKIKQFIRLIVENILQLNGVKNLKYFKLKHDLLKNGYSNDFSTFIITEDDIHQLTKEIVQHFRPQIKKEIQSKKPHNQTTNF